MRLSDSATIQVPFSDIDAFNIVWYGHYSKYFEIVRRKFLNSINYDIKDWKKSSCIWLIVESNYKYLKPITHDQKIKVICYLDEYKYRLKISYKIKDFYSKKGSQNTSVLRRYIRTAIPAQCVCVYLFFLLIN